MDRQGYSVFDSIAHLWDALNLPKDALSSLRLEEDGEFYPSSFKVDHLAHCSIAISALAAALFYSTQLHVPVPRVSVPAGHACAEFKSERLYILDGKPAPSSWGTIGGLHKTKDGYIRMHDSFPTHRQSALTILGLHKDATREEVAERMLSWNSITLESEAFKKGAVIVALRCFNEWEKLPQAKAVPQIPILLQKLRDGQPHISSMPPSSDQKCLKGIRVVEMSRVIAAPVAGKTLAAHGADVIWVTSPNLPDLPDLDRDLARGKKTVQLDITNSEDKNRLLHLLKTADVFIQGYRPGSLAAQGLSASELIKSNPNLIFANLSAWGTEGPWSSNRGFDSLVQTCSGINVADAERYGAGEPAHVLPCQALDHGAGYLLATGIIASLYKRATTGGSYEVNVSLAGVMKYLRSLGQLPGKSGFERRDFTQPVDAEAYLETKMTGFGELTAIRHSANIEGLKIGWDIMPNPLGSDVPAWTEQLS